MMMILQHLTEKGASQNQNHGSCNLADAVYDQRSSVTITPSSFNIGSIL